MARVTKSKGRGNGSKGVNSSSIDDRVFPIDKFKISEEALIHGEYALSYFRQFPYALCSEYLNMRLYPFQKILLYEMMHKYNIIYLACRNIGKTFMTAVYIVVRCILYPKTKVVIVAPTRKQSAEVLIKIEDMMKNSPNLVDEISYISASVHNPKITFWNGSTIDVSTMSENARSARANLVVIDEYVKTDKHIIDHVFSNFMGDPRKPLYLNEDKYFNKKEYDYLKEKDTEIYLSSAGHKGSWGYERFADYFNKMANGENDYFVCALPYQTAVAEGLRSLEFYYKQMTKDGVDEAHNAAEFEGKWIEDGENGFFRFEALESCRKINKAIYPNELMGMLLQYDNKFVKPKKNKDKIRILMADIAGASGRVNDASSYGILELTLKEKTVNIATENGTMKDKIQYYDRDVIYIETHEGMTMPMQANRLKRLDYEYDCNFIALDVANVGLSILDMLGEPSTDPDTGVDYEPIMSMNEEKHAIRCSFPNAIKKIYSIHASAESNDTWAKGLQSAIGQNKLRLLINEDSAEDMLMLIDRYDKIPILVRAKLKQPFLETKFLVNEMVALERANKSGALLRLKEPRSGRKDRYSMLLYGNALADELEQELKSQDGWNENEDIVYSI